MWDTEKIFVILAGQSEGPRSRSDSSICLRSVQPCTFVVEHNLKT